MTLMYPLDLFSHKQLHSGADRSSFIHPSMTWLDSSSAASGCSILKYFPVFIS